MDTSLHKQTTISINQVESKFQRISSTKSLSDLNQFANNSFVNNFNSHNQSAIFKRPRTNYSGVQNGKKIRNIQIVGLAQDPNFQKMKILVQELEQVSHKQIQRQQSNKFFSLSQMNNKNSKNQMKIQNNIIIREQKYSADYDHQINLKNKKQSNQLLPLIKEQNHVSKIQRPAYILVDNKKTYFNINDFAEQEYNQVNFNQIANKYNNLQFEQVSQQSQINVFCQSKVNKYVFMDFKDQYHKNIFRVVFELFNDIAPQACKNFQQLCVGYLNKKERKMYTYRGTSIQRFSPYFFMQGGQLPGFTSIFGGLFQDECYNVNHDVPGILGCANQGRPHTNSSAFYITLDKMEGLNKKGVAFGRVVEGLEDLQNLNQDYDAKNFGLSIINCGRYTAEIIQNSPVESFIEHEYNISSRPSVKFLNSPGSSSKSPQRRSPKKRLSSVNKKGNTLSINSAFSQFTINSPSKYRKMGSSRQSVSKGGSTKRNINRSQSMDSIVTDLQEDEVDEEKLYQKRRELFSFNSFKIMQEETNHEKHLEKYSEKFNLGDDFKDLMLVMENVCLQVKKIINKSYKYESIEELQCDVTDTIVDQLTESGTIALLYNLKEQRQIRIPQSQMGRFILAFNPLDVDKLENIDQCGFMWCVMKKISSSYKPPTIQDFCQLGDKIDCAGYCLYGPNTQLIYHAGFRVNVYTYSVKDKDFKLTFNNVKAPKKAGILSIDLSRIDCYNKNVRQFINRKQEIQEDIQQQYYFRFTRSFLSDFHRTLMYGGVLLLPMDETNDEDGLSILEGYILSYIMEKAWEISSSGEDGSILHKKPVDLKQKINLFVGCGAEIQELENIYLMIRRQKSVFQSLQSKNSI